MMRRPCTLGLSDTFNQFHFSYVLSVTRRIRLRIRRAIMIYKLLFTQWDY